MHAAAIAWPLSNRSSAHAAQRPRRMLAPAAQQTALEAATSRPGAESVEGRARAAASCGCLPNCTALHLCPQAATLVHTPLSVNTRLVSTGTAGSTHGTARARARGRSATDACYRHQRSAFRRAREHTANARSSVKALTVRAKRAVHSRGMLARRICATPSLRVPRRVERALRACDGTAPGASAPSPRALARERSQWRARLAAALKI